MLGLTDESNPVKFFRPTISEGPFLEKSDVNILEIEYRPGGDELRAKMPEMRSGNRRSTKSDGS